jgi:glucokinase-like ROK family protein
MLHSLSLPVGQSQGEEAIQLIYQLIDQLIDYSHSSQEIVGVGIGTPGITDAQRGVVYEAVNLGWHDVPLTDLLAARYPFPIHIANDSQVAALGEYIFGQERKMPNLVVVKAGQGVSAGIVINGRLYIGERSGQGEIGHIVVAENGKPCRCGHRGCLETIVGTPALIEQARHLAQTQPASALHQFARETADIDSDTILAAYQAHDPGVRQMIQEVGHYLAIAIAHLVALLNIQHIVIGGRLARFGTDLINILQAEMAQRVLPKLAEETKLSLSKLGENIVVQGGAALLLAQELELV